MKEEQTFEHSKSIIIIAIIIATLITSAGLTYGLLTTSITVPNTGTFSAINLDIYTTQQCTTSLTQINWGSISPGSSYSYSGYARNNGNLPITLTMATTNWTPTAASAITLTWNYDGRVLQPGTILAITWTLTIPSTISGIQGFSFNIVVTGSG